MLRSTESISMFGVLTPLITRPTEDGNITYSFLQAVGIVNDHLAGCEYR